MKLLKGLAFSALLHALLFGAAFSFVAWRKARADDGMQIDLAGSSLLLRPENARGGARPAAPPQPWILAGKGRTAPQPKAEPLTRAAEAEAGPACPPPCPENSGDWIPAAAASRRPQGPPGLFSEDDYPPELRRKGIEGTVIVNVLIDADGAVRGVTIVQSSEAEFNKLVTDKLMNARFSPAYDQEGKPFASRFQMPIHFYLRN